MKVEVAVSLLLLATMTSIIREKDTKMSEGQNQETENVINIEIEVIAPKDTNATAVQTKNLQNIKTTLIQKFTSLKLSQGQSANLQIEFPHEEKSKVNTKNHPKKIKITDIKVHLILEV